LQLSKYLLSLFLLGGPAFGLNCTNVASTDQPLLQAAMNVASSATVNGPCAINGTLSANAAFTLIGGTTPTITQQAANGTVAVFFNSNGFTMSGLTFNGGGWQSNVNLSDITLTNNTVQFSASGVATNGMIRWKVVGNTISDIWPGGTFKSTEQLAALNLELEKQHKTASLGTIATISGNNIQDSLGDLHKRISTKQD
jgi:hypothetical protein